MQSGVCMNVLKRILLFILMLGITLPIAQSLFSKPPLQSFTQANKQLQENNNNCVAEPAWISKETLQENSSFISASSIGTCLFMPRIAPFIIPFFNPMLQVATYERKTLDEPSKGKYFIQSVLSKNFVCALIAGYVISKALYGTMPMAHACIPNIPVIRQCLSIASFIGLDIGYHSLYNHYCASKVESAYDYVKSAYDAIKSKLKNKNGSLK
jgi:hypothetical protein